MISLVGYTGFVGSNIYDGADGEIDCAYNSKNIEEAYGTKPDLLIYAGLRAEKYLANNAPDKDRELIIEADINELEDIKELLTRNMQEAMELKVKLLSDLNTADNWYDLK